MWDTRRGSSRSLWPSGRAASLARGPVQPGRDAGALAADRRHRLRDGNRRWNGPAHSGRDAAQVAHGRPTDVTRQVRPLLDDHDVDAARAAAAAACHPASAPGAANAQRRTVGPSELAADDRLLRSAEPAGDIAAHLDEDERTRRRLAPPRRGPARPGRRGRWRPAPSSPARGGSAARSFGAIAVRGAERAAPIHPRT